MSAFAPSLAARNLRFLLALAPGATALALANTALPLHLLCAASLAVLLEATCLRLRGSALPAYLAEGGAVRAALLVALWLPALGIAPLLAAVAFAVLLARQAFGGLGRSPVHGAIAGIAFAQLFFGATTLPLDAGAPWTSLALLAGALALVASRQLPWSLPLAFLGTAALAAAASRNGALALLTGAPWLLAAGFVLVEADTLGERLRTRLLLAALAAGVAVFAGGVGARALPFALLAASLLAPWLESRPRPRTTMPASP